MRSLINTIIQEIASRDLQLGKPKGSKKPLKPLAPPDGLVHLAGYGFVTPEQKAAKEQEFADKYK